MMVDTHFTIVRAFDGKPIRDVAKIDSKVANKMLARANVLQSGDRWVLSGMEPN